MRADVNKVGANITVNIAVLCAMHGKTAREVANIAGIKSHSTMDARKTKPGDWTLGQLVHIAAFFNKPVEWLLTDHREDS